MNLFVLFFTFTVALARVPELRWLEEKLPEYDIQESAFRSQKEYTFVYNGQLMTGIPSSSKQHAGSRVQAVVSLQFKTANTAVLKMQHVRMGHLNRQIPNPRNVLPFMAFQEAPIRDPLRRQLQAPVKFTYQDGLIRDIVFDGAEKPWSANMKRGILNLLQVNLKKQNLVDKEEALILNERSRPTNSRQDFYNVMEKTLEGECETSYTVVSEPHPRYSSGSVMNISKSINFEACKQRPHIKYNYRFSDPCPSCNSRYTGDEKFLKSSSTFNYNISGTPESYLIERASVESHYVLVPFSVEGNVMVTYVNQTLVLVKAGPIENSMSQPSNPKPSDSQMIYTPDWDIMKEKFFMEGDEDFLEQSPYPEVQNKVEFMVSILRNLVVNIGEQVQDPAPKYFNNLVVYCRILTRQQLERIWKELYVQTPKDFTPEQRKKIKSLLVDGISSAGTKGSVQFLVEKIKARQISPLMASLAIKNFVQIRTVGKDMIDDLLSLGEHEVSRRSGFLKQSIYLTAGSMMNALCSPNEDLLASEFKAASPRAYCPRQLKQRYVQLLTQKFQSSDQWEDKVLFLKSMSNAGLDLSVFELEKIIKNTDSTPGHPNFIRAEAVLALRQLKDYMPRKVQRILMPIFMNRYEPPEVRIMAAYQILQSMPERPILDQMARRLFSEPSRQVTSFLFSYMHTMANSTNPCEKKLAEDMTLALRHSRFPPFSFFKGYSKLIHKTGFSEKMNFGVDMDLAVAYSNSSYIPRFMGLSYNPVFGGFFARHFATVGVFNEGFEQLFWKYFGDRGYFFEKPLEEILRRSPRSARTRNPSEQLRDMFSSLRIRPREYFPRNPKALLYFRLKDQEYGFLPFSVDHLPEEVSRLLNQGQLNVGRRIERALEEGLNLCIYKGALLHEMSYKIPTTFGVPLRYSATVPTVASLTGHIKAELTENSVKVILRALKPSMVSAWYSHLDTWSPVINSGLSVEMKVSAFYPINGQMEVDWRPSPAVLKMTVQPPSRPVQVFSLQTRPSTYTFAWPAQFRTWIRPEEKTVMGDDWTRVKNYSAEMGEYLLGIKVKTEGYWHRTPQMKLSDTPYCPLSGPNKLVVSTEPGHQMPKEFVVKASSNLFQSTTEELRPEFSEFEASQGSSEEEMTPEMLEQLKSYTPVDPSLHSLRVEIVAKDGPARRFLMQQSLMCDKHYRYCKVSVRMERSPVPRKESKPFKLCMEGEALMPERPQSLSDLAGKKSIAQLKMSWGSSCSSDKYINLHVVGGRSQRQIEAERSSPEYRFLSDPSQDDKTLQSPIFQHQHIAKHANLMEYSYLLQHSKVPTVAKNWTNMAYRYLKHKYFCQTDVAQIQVQNPQNRVSGVLSLDPQSHQYMNISVKSPGENATLMDIPIRLPMVVRPANVHHSRPLMSLVDHMLPSSLAENERSQCHVSSRYINTFDQVKYTVPIGSCWSVLAKDCSSQDELSFGVYMKKLSSDSEQKKVKVVTPYHSILLTPETEDYESVKVQINGNGQNRSPEEVEPLVEHGHVVARMEKIGNYVKLELPESGVSVYFDGYSANIKVSPQYRSIVCGLCGHYDQEPQDEFRSANNELQDDVREFYRSYLLPSDSCQMPESSDVCSSSSCDPTPDSPVYCPVCRQVVRQSKRDSDLTKSELKSTMEQYCDQYSSESSSSCKRFYQPLIQRMTQKIKEDHSEDICSQIRACTPEGMESGNYYSHQESRSLESVIPVSRTKVVEYNDQVCFSKTPVPHCSHYSHPQSHQPEKQVVYACLSRNDPQAETLLHRLHREGHDVLPEVDEFPASFTESERFVDSCNPLA